MNMKKEVRFQVNIITNFTGIIKIMTVNEIVDYLKNNEVNEMKIKKLEKNSTN